MWKQTHSGRFANGQISVAVTIEIAGSATESRTDTAQTRFFRHILEFALTKIVQQAALALARANQEKIGLAVSVVIQKARAGAGTQDCGWRNALGQRLLRVLNGNFLWGRGSSSMHKFRE